MAHLHQKEATDFIRNLSLLFGLRAASGTPSQGRLDVLGRSESALRQGFASQNTCDAALAAKHNKASIPLGVHMFRQGSLLADFPDFLFMRRAEPIGAGFVSLRAFLSRQNVV